jgi:origin recognition complex subunit 1
MQALRFGECKLGMRRGECTAGNADWEYKLGMPHQTAPLTPQQNRANKAERARKLLAGASLQRDDSEDEDQPWEWIYEKGTDEEDEDDSADEDGGDKITAKKRKRPTVSKPQEKRIVGARTGNIKYKIGDSVLLKPPDGGAPWVGMILKFLEDDEGEMSANFLCRIPKPISKRQTLI